MTIAMLRFQGDKSKSQPYNAHPWKAEFRGCCRQHRGRGESFNYAISAHVDVDDHV
jgi:hypothetical protein